MLMLMENKIKGEGLRTLDFGKMHFDNLGMFCTIKLLIRKIICDSLSFTVYMNISKNRFLAFFGNRNKTNNKLLLNSILCSQNTP